MAMTTINPAKMNRNEGTVMGAFVQLTSLAEGGAIPFNGEDSKLLVMVENVGTAAKTVTFFGGNGPQASGDLVASVPAGSTHGFTFDSGYFKQVTGAYKGMLRFTTQTTDLKVSAVLLP